MNDALDNRSTQIRMQRLLDTVERVGNRVPHPVIIFVILMLIVIVLSQLFYLFGVGITYQRINPETDELETLSAELRSLLPSTVSASCSPASSRTS